MLRFLLKINSSTLNFSVILLSFFSTVANSSKFFSSLKKEIDLELSLRIANVGFIFSKVVVLICGLSINKISRNKESVFKTKSKILIFAFCFTL